MFVFFNHLLFVSLVYFFKLLGGDGCASSPVAELSLISVSPLDGVYDVDLWGVRYPGCRCASINDRWVTRHPNGETTLESE